jgi:hypothetical protein
LTDLRRETDFLLGWTLRPEGGETPALRVTRREGEEWYKVTTSSLRKLLPSEFLLLLLLHCPGLGASS